MEEMIVSCDFRHQFKEDTNQDKIAYQHDKAATQRIAKIYGTARIGRLSTKDADEMWKKYFSLIWKNRSKIPSNRNDFEYWIRGKIKKLSEYLKWRNQLQVGLAQKFLNLFLKDLWAFREIKEKVSASFHIPIDRILLARFSEYPDSWKNWTKVVAKNSIQFDTRYSEYLQMQYVFRSYVSNFDGFSVLDLEQLLWHKIEVEQHPSLGC